MATNYQDFLGQGGTGVNVQANAERARQLDPNEQPNPANPGGLSNNELARRKRAELESANLAAGGRQRLLNSGQKTAGPAPGKWGLASTDASRRATSNAPNDLWGDIGTIWGSDPVTTAVLAAPYAVVGGGLAAGGGALAGAGTGGGAVGGGTLGGVATGTAGTMGAPTMMASPFAATAATPTLGAVGTVASPFAAGAAAPAMAGAAGGAGGVLGTGLSVSDMIGLGGLGLGVGSLIASQVKTDAEKNLLAKQKELAAAAEQRQRQAEQERLNRLGQQLLAFNPRNQMMAEMFGPGAAYTPEQMSGLVGDAGANPSLAGGTPGVNGSEEDIMRANADARRRQQLQSAFQAPGQGPAPIQQRAPQAARRF